MGEIKIFNYIMSDKIDNVDNVVNVVNNTNILEIIPNTLYNYKYSIFGIGIITLTTISYRNGYLSKLKNLFY